VSRNVSNTCQLVTLLRAQRGHYCSALSNDLNESLFCKCGQSFAHWDVAATEFQRQLGLPKRNGLFVQPFDDALLQRLRDYLGDRLRIL